MRGIRTIHFVGIGGIGMCGIAELLHHQGYRITGSDLRDGVTMTRLRSLGIPIAVGHNAEQIGAADVVVYSSAVRPNNPELVAAAQHKIPVIPRAEMLAEIMRLRDGIAVAGSHGKTTTTSLIAHVLDAAGLDPTAVIGGRVRGAERTGTRMGGSALLVAEADESDGSFLRLAPVIAVITNIDPEHLDHYGSVDALHAAFAAFANHIPFWGLAVVCLDHPGVQRLLPHLTRRFTTYGLSPQAELSAHEIEATPRGTRFAVRHAGRRLGVVELPLPGLHNVQNTLATLCVARELEVPFAVAAQSLAAFPGIERRFEVLGEARGVLVIDDYGHHPAEVRATLAAARERHPGRVVVVFQPHRYSRTRDLFDEFATAFHEADLLVLTEIYAAGEAKLPEVEASRLAETIAERGHRDVRFVADLETIPETLVPELEAGDWVITLGAGSIAALGPRLLDALSGANR